ncbi:MAG: cytochrome c biogenesis heme-transporting ATPase CcmA [Gammaproteobacteria bacterium]|nr:cytochrome c biogenesis heme-transporting ATPase CcmA [Gammaproteobacteria bacterium]
MTAQLFASQLTLFRGERCLFTDLNFALNPSQLLLLEGRNGSGKTSLMRAIAGLIEFESGEILWGGISVRSNRQAFHGALVWMAHRVGFKADLTLVENLRFESHLRSQSKADFDDVLQRLDIDRLKRLPLRSLSAGQQRRVALARMLLSQVPLWLMDEPFTNLDREGRALVMQLTTEHLADGGMCIMAAHQDVEIDADVTKIVLQ